MACNCRHSKREIETMRRTIAVLRELFIKRMTEDSVNRDKRSRAFNQAIFSDYGNGEYQQCFNGTNMEMVLYCFDNAEKDLRDTYCDQRKPSCTKI